MRSYKSAFPTWTTYTPATGPVGAQPAINQENWWRNRARQWTPTSAHGHFQRMAMDVASQLKGTGAGALAGAVVHPRGRPIMNKLQKMSSQRREWTRQMQQAMLQQQITEDTASPEEDVEGEATPFPAPSELATGRSSPPPVDPADVATKEAAGRTSETLARATMASPRAGTTTIKSTKSGGSITINERRGRR